jgi:hypothetical protein
MIAGALPEVERLQQQILMAQNKDGGWPYLQPLVEQPRLERSWTEPTALALLACNSYTHADSHRNSVTADACGRGLAWLAARQRPDGGWAPNDQVDFSTSVTSLAALAVLRAAGYQSQAEKAISWTQRQVYSDQLTLGLLLSRVTGQPAAHAPGSVPWYPGTAGWVIPTSLSVVALEEACRVWKTSQFSATVRQSQAYLLSRRCSDGGWNHGGSNTRSESAGSYPETTGLALLALSSLPPGQLSAPVTVGEALLKNPESLEGLSWLQLGLVANRKAAPDPESMRLQPRNSRDAALRMLALAAREGRPSFLSKSE